MADGDGRRSVWSSVGPGILFAGAAVGVSHLVQSTRAGAGWGLALLAFVLLANVFKYAAFRFGPEYAAATGRSLLEGYRRQGRWALVLYAVMTLGTMFTVEAAVAVVAAALAKVLFGLSWAVPTIAALMIALCTVLLAVGRYRWLDRVTKGIVAVLTLSTLAATLLALPRIEWSSMPLWPQAGFFGDVGSILFLAALVGWMPSAIDVAAWQSLWTLARSRETGRAPQRDGVLFDFHVGYYGTVLLAVCFVVLGASVMYGSGAAFAPGAGAFAAQVLDLYATTLGEWSRPIVGTAALATMFSTTLTVVDGFPRALAVLVARFRGPEEEGDPLQANQRVYWVALAVLAVGSVAILELWLTSLAALIDVATTLSFLTAPALAWLNHRAMFSAEVPVAARPSAAMRLLSQVSIAVLSLFAVYYLYLLVRYG